MLWTYYHFMVAHRIGTPQDLGAALRDARRAQGATQADLARRAGVSREWLIGVEQGKRPRAELGKILAVLTAARLPMMLGSDSSETAGADTPSSTGEGPASRGDITRRAIARARRRPESRDEAAADSARSNREALILAPALRQSISKATAASSPSLMPEISPSLQRYLEQALAGGPEGLEESGEAEDQR